MTRDPKILQPSYQYPLKILRRGWKQCFNFRSAEALLLKGSVLLDLKRYTDATSHFREALMVAPHHYELHKYRFYIVKNNESFAHSLNGRFPH